MHLEEYLYSKGISRRKFARLVGVSDAFISFVANGRRKPSPAVARRIEEASKGQVTIEDLFYPHQKTKGKTKLDLLEERLEKIEKRLDGL